MYGIIGSGFGLYGYLPALIFLEKQVALYYKAREILSSRAELVPYLNKVIWLKDREEILEKCTSLVISVPPFIQEEILTSVFERDHIEQLILEKPIGLTPLSSGYILDTLINSRINFRVDYIFLYTSWNKQLLQKELDKKHLTIMWTFMAHHYSHSVLNWKRYHKDGGGALRFYGVHIIAFLAQFASYSVISSVLKAEEEDGFYIWDAVLLSDSGTECKVHVNTKSPLNKFSICERQGNTSSLLIDKSSPFEDEGMVPGQDLRVSPLLNLFKDLETGVLSSIHYDVYTRSIKLWSDIERHTIFQSV